MEAGSIQYGDIVKPNAAVSGNRIKSSKDVQELAERNRKSMVRFKSLHLLVVGFFLWILFLHAIGIYFFTKGFLLTRLVLNDKSECLQPPLKVSHTSSIGGGCWHPKQFDKAIIIIIDALRYDFTVPYQAQPRHYHNTLTVLHETAIEQPHNAFLLPFIADPPTVTLQRLKGLTTGTLPTFVDAGASFSGTAIEEDNILAQLREANKTLVHLGDDTWHSLFPGYFDANLTHAYDSFNAWDLHTVDDGITEHLLPLLAPELVSRWDVLFAHFLGVDHAGHRYGPNHPAMAAKLSQMDAILRQLVEVLDDQTLLVVMGDHGMDAKGDHGGESDDEVEAALWMYSKKASFGRSKPEYVDPPATAKERAVAQIDLVPTLSLLLGLPIPFNNLGAPIEEAFIGPNEPEWEKLAIVNALTGAQIHNYQVEYSQARGLDEDATSLVQERWLKAINYWVRLRFGRLTTIEDLQATYTAFSDYQIENLHVCRSLWARFDIPNMLQGIGILSFALLSTIAFARPSSEDRADSVPALLQKIGIGIPAGASIAYLSRLFIPDTLSNDCVAFGAAIGGLIGNGLAFWQNRATSFIGNGMTLWGWMAIVFTLSQSIGFASNSYTIWEDEILLFFLSSFGVIAAAASLRQVNTTDRILGMYHSLLFLGLTRVSSFSRLCRDEQMPYCRSTYYASATTSTSATWQLLISYFVAILLPEVIKSYYQRTKSYEGSARFWIGFAFRIGLLGSAIYWTLDTADDGNWLSMSSTTLLNIRINLAQIILAVAFGAGTTTFIWAAPCIRLEVAPVDGSSETGKPKPKTMTILGYANVHGSRYFLLFSAWLLGIILLQKPMGGGMLGLLALQILSLLEIVDTNDLSQSAIGPIVLALLGSFHFFKTGHQATPASIQWNVAFIALKTVRYPWSPILIVLNTFGAQILTVIAVPLVVLWKQPPKKTGLLGDVARAMMRHICYYGVINLATTIWAGWLRRHLMLYRIFSPRFMTGAAVLLVVDLVGALVAVGGYRWNVVAINEVFGW
ncbi:mannose-ethanolamine phosphotransferase gpi13 [Xylographa opegraphella]|nr:mannose-ethanolamine phosphotransferase gpi13 [Xylographa opegraphella]